MCPMPGDDVTPAVTPGSRPFHHSGPGYVANRKAPDFELDAPLRQAAVRWLNLVPAEHRHESRESAKDALETLREHTRSCPDHPLGALWVAHRHLRDPVPAVRIASLVLASEALWWLGHFEDARRAAQAAGSLGLRRAPLVAPGQGPAKTGSAIAVAAQRRAVGRCGR